MFVILANTDWWVFDRKSLLGKTLVTHKYCQAKDKK